VMTLGKIVTGKPGRMNTTEFQAIGKLSVVSNLSDGKATHASAAINVLLLRWPMR
jgi:hypothetical protein